MRIYVDVDGTLLDSRLDNLFKEQVARYGIEQAVAWYNGTYIDDLEINYDLVDALLYYYEMGHELILWTNRGRAQVDMTIKNLEPILWMFSDMIFGEGRKLKNKPIDGLIVDNEVIG